MASRKSSKSKKTQKNHILEIVIVLILAFLAGYYFNDADGFTGEFGKLSSMENMGEGKAYFHFINVGQGDSTLITSGNQAVVIDTGSASEADYVSEYINRYTSEVEYMILTHPHEDHMGCAAEVLRNVEVKNIIMPAASSDAKYFSRFLDVVEEKDINVIQAVPGNVYTAGEITLTILAPLEDSYDNTNNYSVVTRVDVGETSVLFTGDAEMEVEKALLARYTTALDCDLFQAGHHGSTTSNTKDFIAAVSPAAAVISCGKDNSYGHPHAEVLNTFTDFGIEVFRTDELGNIVFVSDGVGISKYQ